jgi:hypothetical protein
VWPILKKCENCKLVELQQGAIIFFEMGLPNMHIHSSKKNPMHIHSWTVRQAHSQPRCPACSWGADCGARSAASSVCCGWQSSNREPQVDLAGSQAIENPRFWNQKVSAHALMLHHGCNVEEASTTWSHSATSARQAGSTWQALDRRVQVARKRIPRVITSLSRFVWLGVELAVWRRWLNPIITHTPPAGPVLLPCCRTVRWLPWSF